MANLLCQKMLTLTIQNHLELIHEKEEEILGLTELVVRMEEEEAVITEKQTTDPLREGDKIKKSCDYKSRLFHFYKPFALN